MKVVETPPSQIGEVAERVQLLLRTVRCHEEMGLLVPEKRTGGGFRMYSDDQVERLQLIKRMKPQSRRGRRGTAIKP